MRAELEREPGRIVDAHLPDPGRLRELLRPGRRLWLAPARSSARKTRWTAILTETPDDQGFVSIDATLPNRLVARALQDGQLHEFGPYGNVRSEPRSGSHRFDFLLERPAGSAPPEGNGTAPGSGSSRPASGDLLLEVKSVTLVEEGIGLFPDAVTERGARHVRELAKLARSGRATAVLFVLQRQDAGRVRAARTIDPGFADALEEAVRAGVQVRARRCQVSHHGIELADPVPVDVGPSPTANGSEGESEVPAAVESTREEESAS